MKIRKLFSLMAFQLLFWASAIAQTGTITGKVTDASDQPVPYATVAVKGTTIKTATDDNGKFTIKAKKGDILVVSAVGVANKEVTVTSAEMAISVNQSANKLSDVVVTTALGIKRSKNQLPYAAQVVSGADITRDKSPNFFNNLSGTAAGLDIKQTNTMGGSTNIVLRGNKSITQSNQALIVVDGVPYNNNTPSTVYLGDDAGRSQRGGSQNGYDYGNNGTDFNPEDIESMTILPGPAASALYGSQGANGVIVINTKKMKKGLGITVNSGYTMGKADMTTFPTYQNKYGAGYGAYYEDATGYFLERTGLFGNAAASLVVPMNEDASYGAAFDPNLMVYTWNSFDYAGPLVGKKSPWVAATNTPAKFLQTANSFANSIFLNTGNDKSNFKMGYTRNDETGILPGSKITKNLLTFAGSYNMTDKLTVSATFNMSRTDGKGRYTTGYSGDNVMSSFRQWWQTNVDILQQKDAYFRNNQNITWNWSDPNDLKPAYWDNPYWSRYQNYETDWRNRYFGNVALNYKINSWINVSGRISMDQYEELQEQRLAVGSLDPSNYKRNNTNRRQLNYDLMATMDKDLSDKFNLKGLLGVNIRKDQRQEIAAQTNGGLVVPNIYSLSNSKSPLSAKDISEFYGKKEVDGIYAGATLTYDKYLTLDATIRRDASSTLPKGNNVYYYPSVSLGFIFSNLLPNAAWLSYGKVRANYATVGSDAPYYALKNTYSFQPAFGTETLYSLTTINKNPNLMPERTRSYELGLELAFLKNRANLNFTYYNASSFNQIVPADVSRATGFNQDYKNTGEVSNKGVEITLGGSPVKTKDFIWNITVNWSKNINKVVELYTDPAGNKITNITLESYQGGVTTNAALGQPYGVIKGQDFVYYNDPNRVNRDPSQRIVLANGRYQLSTSSNYIIGNPNPNWIGGIRNSFSYKGFNLGFLIDIRSGGDIFSLDMYYGLATGLYPETADLNDNGKPLRSPIANGGGIIRPGVTSSGLFNQVRANATTYGAYGYRYTPAAGFIYDGGYVKLREVSLAYTLPKSFVNKIKFIKDIQLSLVGRNLWIIHKNLPYADPEDNYGAGNSQGYQGNSFPAVKNYTFNLRFTL